MEMKQYLVDTFLYNSHANIQVLQKVKELRDKEEAIKLFSHLVNSQNKWLDRIFSYPKPSSLDWWEPVYTLDMLESKWHESIDSWIAYLQQRTEQELFEEVRFVGYDNGVWACSVKDIALQLNYHSIHHRAQVQTIIRQHGLVPDFVDYIGTVYKKLS